MNFLTAVTARGEANVYIAAGGVCMDTVREAAVKRKEAQMEDLSIQNVDLEESENLERHRTQGFGSSGALVVRRGAPFKVSVQLRGRAFNPRTDSMGIKVMLGRLFVTMPVTYSRQRGSSSGWTAHVDPDGLRLHKPSVSICPPASASVGCYRFQLCVFTTSGQEKCTSGKFILLCNPWCQEDAVYIPFEDQREEYVHNDAGLLFMGTPMNLVSRPWSFDLYEPGVLEACLNMLQISPQHQTKSRLDYLNRSSPVYISRVVSAMINSEDDRGVLKGNWSDDFKQGVHPSMWSGSGDILRQWAQTGYSPVKYGQCWVFAAVMCTVMRVLGIPCRVVTNFNSAHDTNSNLVIEEYYSETGQKLNTSKDSIWNFHIWVECWMARGDLGSGLDGWQVLDPTPQERSGGVFCCGPAPVKAIRDRRIDLLYDVPFVYAEVNADVHRIVVSQGRVLSLSKDTERVGSLICTKAIGFPRVHNITGDYKQVKSPTSTLRSVRSTASDNSTLTRGPSEGVLVSLHLDKAPVAGEPIAFTVKIMNKQRVAKKLKVHLNAQVKEYNPRPAEELKTFWESHGVLQLAPMEVKLLSQQILPSQYRDLVGDKMINLAAVLQDTASREHALASEEFNIASPQILIQIADEKSIVPNKEQAATVSFTNPFPHPVGGTLTVAGAGLIQGKLHFRLLPLLPGRRVEQRIAFNPSMVGTKMLQASLTLTDISTTIRGFKMVAVNNS
ncbi:transglutaminase 5, like isoform X2 [Betta splendens]|uniref:protein-glutamine gamma-glutamyltransferase n=1 Tax=Betta splendens TaxID=158456 RepID=A0A6P7MKG0_BETSP|nr:transglutaminase 5, like isoform X2 [Betta splendens]